MKKTAILTFGLALCFGISSAAHAVCTIANTGNPGTPVTCTGGSGPSINEFLPSTNVIMDGESDATAAAVGAYHQQVLNKKSGKAFAMSTDTNKIFFADISTQANDTNFVIGGTNSGAIHNATVTYTAM